MADASLNLKRKKRGSNSRDTGMFICSSFRVKLIFKAISSFFFSGEFDIKHDWGS